MLKTSYYTEPSELDQLMFEKLVPEDHYLRKVKALQSRADCIVMIDFESMRTLVADCYSADMGRGAEDPVLMIKLGFLQFHYGLSDREVLAEAQVNVAYRYFLDLSLESRLPSIGLMSQFRTRLGSERYQILFDAVVGQARERGLVKDRSQSRTDWTWCGSRMRHRSSPTSPSLRPFVWLRKCEPACSIVPNLTRQSR